MLCLNPAESNKTMPLALENRLLNPGWPTLMPRLTNNMSVTCHPRRFVDFLRLNITTQAALLGQNLSRSGFYCLPACLQTTPSPVLIFRSLPVIWIK